jgi:hypothetical protein
VISPETLREFLLEPYKKYIAAVKDCGVWAIAV